MLSGLRSGGITVQGIRAGEGDIMAYYKEHDNAISVIKLDDDERSAISGSWDKTIIDWDLETGKPKRKFLGAQSQISSIEWQPVGGSLIPREIGEASLKVGLKGSINGDGPSAENGKSKKDGEQEDEDDDMDSLFGDDEEEEGSGNEASKNDAEDDDGDVKMEDSDPKPIKSKSTGNGTARKTNEISHSVFLSSSIDGIVDIWDRRQEKRAARIRVTEGVPPWAASASWSSDGNSIYVGRRNSCVEEFHINKSLKAARTFRFPTVSGAVSAVKSMPSGRHLLCGSHDNLRLYDLKANIDDSVMNRAVVGAKPVTPFYIIPGHHGGVISAIYIDPSCEYLVTTSGGRGWMGASTDVALVYDITGIP